MIEINGVRIETSWTEYAARIGGLGIVNCDDRTEAEQIIASSGGELVYSKHYITDWVPVGSTEEA